jgi:hypothetical protein
LDTLSILFLSALSFVSPLLLIPVSELMSSVYNNSSAFKRNALEYSLLRKDKAGGVLVQRELKSLQPIRCQVGGFYHMEASAKLTLFDRVIQGVVFALLLQI